MPVQDSALGQIVETDGGKLSSAEEQDQQREGAKAKEWLQSDSAEEVTASSRIGPLRSRRRDSSVASDNRNAGGNAEKGKGKNQERDNDARSSLRAPPTLSVRARGKQKVPDLSKGV
jgi:hypothetical protein